MSIVHQEACTHPIQGTHLRQFMDVILSVIFGIILDDVRDMAYITDNQDKLQGKYDAHVEFATTQGGTCAYKKYLFATPIVVTGNYSTGNLGFLQSHDWLGRDLNRVVVEWGENLGNSTQRAAF